MMALSLFLGVAMAAEVSVGPRVSVTLDDPFLTQVGLGAAGSLALDRAPWLGLGGGAMLFPQLEAGYRCLCQSVSELDRVYADLSPVRWNLWLTPELSTPWLALRDWETRVGGHGGLAVLQTEDDLSTVDPDLFYTSYYIEEREIHFAPLYGLHAELRRGRWGGRVDLDRARWTEHVFLIEEKRSPLTLAASVQSWF